MPSCPTPCLDASTATTATTEVLDPGEESVQRPGLLQLLSTIEDFRDPRGRRHTMASVLAIGLAAVIAGARSYVAIGEWAPAQDTSILIPLGMNEVHGVPERPRSAGCSPGPTLTASTPS